MKTLSHHVLIFDNHCPLCKAYSGAFIKTGMLDHEGRRAYDQIDSEICRLFDQDRARNEIALVDTYTGQVMYGIDSLFRIISNAFPFLTPLFQFKFFRWFMKKLYSFISYNRKVIIPSKIGQDRCVPDLSLRYRWAYIIFTWFITSLILTQYSKLIVGVVPPSTIYGEFLICGGQILFQSVAMYFINKNKIITYLGNMMTVSFAGGIFLLLVMGVGRVVGIQDPLIFSVLFLFTAGLMFIEHMRRMKLLGIHWSISFTWILYRVLLLGFIL